MSVFKNVVRRINSLAYKTLTVAELSDSTSPSVLTVEETIGKNISTYKAGGAAHEFKVVAAHAHGNVCIVCGDTGNVTITPVTGTLFYLNGVAMDTNESIVNTAAALGERVIGTCENLNGTLLWHWKSDSANFVEAAP